MRRAGHGARQSGGRANLASVLIALAVFLLSAATALGHASLVRTVPADGETVAGFPTSLLLSFNEPVSPLVLTLVKPDGTSVLLDRFRLKDRGVEIDAPAGLGHGTFVLNWRVVSEDGHPVGGAVVFSVGQATAPGRVAVPEVDWTVRIATWTARLASYLGFFFGVGGAFFIAWFGSPGPGARRFAAVMTAVGICGLLLSAAALGLDALAMPIGEIAGAPVWRAAFSTTYGTTVAAGCLSALLALASLARRSPRKTLSALAMGAVGLALAASGHASTAPPRWLMQPALLLHALAVAAWAGALVPLALWLRSPSAGSASTLLRFSALAPGVVAVLVGSGAVLATVQLGTPRALANTPYGQVLTAKLVLVSIVLGLAAVNRWRLTGPVGRGDRDAARTMARIIAIEAVLIAAVLGTVALWRFTPPPRALAAVVAPPAHAHLHAASAMADLAVSPGRVGTVRAHVDLATADGRPLEAKEVTLVLWNDTAGIRPFRRAMTRDAAGRWTTGDFTFPLPGRWSARVDALVTDFEMVKLEGSVEIGP